MAGIFNSAIFNNAIFNTGSAPVVVTTTPSGVRKGKGKRELIVRLSDVQNRADTAEFLKAQLRLRHPDSAFDEQRDAEQERHRLAAQAKREKDMRDKAVLLAAMAAAAEAERIAKEKKLLDDNNKYAIILTMIAAQMDDL